jgi:hypothetical protein
MGRRIWVGCGWIFLGDRGGEEKRPGHIQEGQLSMDDTCCQTVPFFMLYRTVGVLLLHAADHRERYPRSSMPWEDMYTVEVSTT